MVNVVRPDYVYTTQAERTFLAVVMYPIVQLSTYSRENVIWTQPQTEHNCLYTRRCVIITSTFEAEDWRLIGEL